MTSFGIYGGRGGTWARFFLSFIQFILANHDFTHPLVCAARCDVHAWRAVSRYRVLMTFQLTIEEFNSKWWLGTGREEFSIWL
jgi:hypothetical protein